MNNYTEYAGELHRRSLGQYFTHPKVAGFMVRWVLGSGHNVLFDPAFGLGAFREAVRKEGAIGFSASEIDPQIIRFWERQAGQAAEFVAVEDYLLSWGKAHPNIVCNPPYMRFQKFLNRKAVFSDFERKLGIRLSGYTNTASAFLVKSISELAPTGRLAYIMPLEFLNAGYGTIVKQQLIESRHLAAILSLDCEKDVFPDVTTSIGIVLFDKAVRQDTVKFYSLRSVEDLSDFHRINPISEMPCSRLDPNQKWLPLFQKSIFAVDTKESTVLRSFGRFSRGIATGANEFFVLRPSSARKLAVDEGSECVPCITKSSQVCAPIFDVSDYAALYAADKPVLLFSPKERQSCGAAEYIKSGEAAGFNARFLTKNRKPWYKTESRRPAPLLLGAFSRGGYKVILNRTNTLHLTCFHGFQPNLFGEQHLEHIFLYLWSNIGRGFVSLSMRKYGDSLDKFEPNDLNDALVPSADFLAAMPEDKVPAAVREIVQTGRAPNWVEDFFAQLKVGQEKESVFVRNDEKKVRRRRTPPKAIRPEPKVGALRT